MTARHVSAVRSSMLPTKGQVADLSQICLRLSVAAVKRLARLLHLFGSLLARIVSKVERPTYLFRAVMSESETDTFVAIDLVPRRLCDKIHEYQNDPGVVFGEGARTLEMSRHPST